MYFLYKNEQRNFKSDEVTIRRGKRQKREKWDWWNGSSGSMPA
jgi:hypothetical protein